MKNLTTILITLILVSCNTKSVVNTDTTADNIQKEKAHLAHVKFTNAIQVYGEPQMSNKIKVEEKNLSEEQLTIVNEYFPNKEYNSKKVFFLEAQWKRPTNAELTVWYLFIENEWKPIEVRAKA
ncbi:hypothetical protein UMM65_07375 [Aureibaculum sp. 2210JD6-5]|uniref:hypothetical protein n=1 Tax=Aureibaculum sp. 2210JD6-5 TaxID=3103957 RepID=UPI002AAD029A|nr:hypothetical protein [Aureibaculum sp. 2210JD6-5]MDY7395057.1 hypothetical protein [Aureibaculum sp. 2210JD6-5]